MNYPSRNINTSSSPQLVLRTCVRELVSRLDALLLALLAWSPASGDALEESSTPESEIDAAWLRELALQAVDLEYAELRRVYVNEADLRTLAWAIAMLLEEEAGDHEGLVRALGQDPSMKTLWRSCQSACDALLTALSPADTSSAHGAAASLQPRERQRPLLGPAR